MGLLLLGRLAYTAASLIGCAHNPPRVYEICHVIAVDKLPYEGLPRYLALCADDQGTEINVVFQEPVEVRQTIQFTSVEVDGEKYRFGYIRK